MCLDLGQPLFAFQQNYSLQCQSKFPYYHDQNYISFIINRVTTVLKEENGTP